MLFTTEFFIYLRHLYLRMALNLFVLMATHSAERGNMPLMLFVSQMRYVSIRISIVLAHECDLVKMLYLLSVFWQWFYMQLVFATFILQCGTNKWFTIDGPIRTNTCIFIPDMHAMYLLLVDFIVLVFLFLTAICLLFLLVCCVNIRLWLQ